MKAKISNRGETGIGTLIIFIAIVLVAAIAAGVLLSTAGSLQQKALTTGKQSQQEVSSGIQVVSMSATDGSAGSVNTFEVIAKLASGSDPLGLGDTIISFDTKTTSQNLVYSANTYDSSNFYVNYLKNGSDHLDAYLTTGDLIKITFTSTGSIGQSNAVRMKIVPKHGVITPINFVTPDVMNTVRVSLYP